MTTPKTAYLLAAEAAAVQCANEMNIETARIAYRAAFAIAAESASTAAAAIYTENANKFINDLIAYMGGVSETASKNPTKISSIMYDKIMLTLDASCDAYIATLTPPII